MKGIKPSRKDDLESIGYMLIYLYTQYLPWKNFRAKNKIELKNQIFQMKSLIPIKTLCKDTPKEMNEFMKYTKSLKSDEKPNYNYLTELPYFSEYSAHFFVEKRSTVIRELNFCRVPTL